MIHLGLHADNWRPLSAGFETAYRRDELALATLLKEGRKLGPNLKGLKS
jgi:hypothetical protein